MSCDDIVYLMAPKLAEIFGAKNGNTAVAPVGRLVKSFNFTRVHIDDKEEHDHLHTCLAPSFGTLTPESIRDMEKNMKIMIAGTNRHLENVHGGELSWDKILPLFMQNPLLEHVDTPFGNIQREDKLIHKGWNWVFSEQAPEAPVVDVREVHSWFQRLILNDEDVLKSTNIDTDVFKDIVAAIGAAIAAGPRYWGKREYQKTILDISVVRYPDLALHYFKVYRIQLIAWSDMSRALIRGSEASGVTGQYNMRLFQPRSSVIDGMKAETKLKAAKAAEDMFACTPPQPFRSIDNQQWDHVRAAAATEKSGS